MRKIKFRAKFRHIRTRKEVWQYSEPNHKLDFGIDGYVQLTNWEQYIGLKDKNGIEIYEGDLVKTRTLSEELWGNELSIYEVGFFQGTFCLVRKEQYVRQWKDGTHDWYSLENTESFEIEVLGNIHENKELLTKK